MKTFVMIGLIFVLNFGILVAEENKPDDSKKNPEAFNIPEVKEAYDNYVTSLNTTVGNYVKILNKEEESQTKKGNLEILEKIKKERDEINVLEPVKSSVDWGKNNSLNLGKKSFNTGLEKNKKDYLNKLEMIQKKLVQDKKIDDAKIVRDYIEELKMEEVRKSILGQWQLYKNNQKDTIHTFKDNNEGVSSTGNRFTWKVVTINKIEQVWESDKNKTVVITIENNTLKWEDGHSGRHL